MNILIIEDEELAVRKLQKTILSVIPDAHILGSTDSIHQSVEWLQTHEAPDLIFMDIELADGQSFEIFRRVDVRSPVIFTTSYDEFALQAFKVNSIDYLLKPVQQEDLKQAIRKLETLRLSTRSLSPALQVENILKELQDKLQVREYRKRFLVKQAQKLVSVDVQDIAYFFSDGRVNFFRTHTGQKYIVDYTMDELEDMLNPSDFFRISRSFLVSVGSIEKMDDYFGNRLILHLQPASEKEVLVSREKVQDFKKWMGK